MSYIDTVIKQIDINVFRQLVTSNAEFAKEVINILSANSVQIYGCFLSHPQAGFWQAGWYPVVFVEQGIQAVGIWFAFITQRSGSFVGNEFWNGYQDS